MRGGDLQGRLRKVKRYSEEKAAILMRNLLGILLYLDENQIVHRDIKLNNILLVDEDDDTTIKLADFGLTTFIINKNFDDLIGGTPGYLAPELFRFDRATNKSDIFSAGAILFIL